MKTLTLSLLILSIASSAIASTKSVFVPWDSETCTKRQGIVRGDKKCELRPIVYPKVIK